MTRFWSVLAQAARLVLELSERQIAKAEGDRPIVEVIKEQWGR